jgi:hypothetical protein
MRNGFVRVVVLTLVLALALNPVVFAAEGDPSGDSSGNTASDRNTASDIGLGVASFLISIPYGAAKVATALLGGIVGGFTYVLSGFNKKAADQVWYTTIPGDYIITPDHLRGKKDIRFTGVPPENR